MFPINVVEKETTISKYLLRMWERRYSFPRPARDTKGERLYSQTDVEKLKLVKSLMDCGYRPSKIIDQDIQDLRNLYKTFIDKNNVETHDKKEIILILTEPKLEEELRMSFKNHKVKEVYTISSSLDITNLPL